MKKMKISQISLKNLQRYNIRTSVMVIFTMLIVGMTFTSTILLNSMEDSIDNTINQIGSDIIVVPSEYEDDLKDSLFLGEPCSFYFDKKYQEKISEIEGIKNVSPQLYITSLASECCTAEVQLIAFDSESDFIVKPWAEEIGVDKLDDNHVLVGNSIDEEVGGTITFFGKEFIVAGKLNDTDTTYDESAFISFNAAKELLNDDTLKTVTGIDNPENVISSLMIRTENGVDIKKIARTINYSLENAPIKAYTLNGMFQSISDKMLSFKAYSKIMITLLVVVSMIALMCIFTITINERKYEFGVLASLGAKKSHIIKIIIFEALAIGLIGGIFGVVLSTLGIYLFKNIISTNLGILYFYYDSLYIVKIAVINIFMGIIISLISSINTVISMSKTDLIKMIKEVR
jgi:putative ABC transport system permease protein